MIRSLPDSRQAGSKILVALLFSLRLVAQPVADHHLYLTQSGGGAAALIAEMNAAGVRKGAVLVRTESEAESLAAANDRTREQVSLYPKRLVAICAVDLQDDYAGAEIRRWGEKPGSCRGVHILEGAVAVDLLDGKQAERMRQIFHVANENRLAVVIRAPRKAEQARLFLETVLPEARDVAVQLTDLWGDYAGAGRGVIADAIAARDKRVQKLYLDLTGMSPGARMTELLRDLGWSRIVFGSGGQIAAAWRKALGLAWSAAEMRKIERNVAPYLK